MMCGVCGCGKVEVQVGSTNGHRHDEHQHTPHQTDDTRRLVQIEQDILSENAGYAVANRELFEQQALLALNLVSSPGSGKTSLLTATITRLSGQVPLAVIEGDQQTSRDAERIRAAGATALQINTGKGCHLDAHMIGHAMQQFTNLQGGLLFIENVGNLVCPAGFYLGEAHRVVILSVTEGDDKPLKYPDIFHHSDLLLINKIDLLPYVEFDLNACIDYARRINPDIEVIQLSARTGEGMESWVDWVNQRRQQRLQQRISALQAEAIRLESLL
ncbi:hydrogenase nickel incorporation protein HypB [Marinobacterium iners]|nr:hydrogenase nickel incorporation protein HypB [Marinobacterium iners]